MTGLPSGKARSEGLEERRPFLSGEPREKKEREAPLGEERRGKRRKNDFKGETPMGGRCVAHLGEGGRSAGRTDFTKRRGDMLLKMPEVESKLTLKSERRKTGGGGGGWGGGGVGEEGNIRLSLSSRNLRKI